MKFCRLFLCLPVQPQDPRWTELSWCETETRVAPTFSPDLQVGQDLSKHREKIMSNFPLVAQLKQRRLSCGVHCGFQAEIGLAVVTSCTYHTCALLSLASYVALALPLMSRDAQKHAISR